MHIHTKAVFVALMLIGFTLAAPASAARVVVTVDVSSRTLNVEKDGRELHTWQISVAKPGYGVPLGRHRLQSIERGERPSTQYGGLMIKPLFFQGDYGIHGVDLPIGGQVSNGCFHISRSNANKLYEIVYPNRGSTVVVVKQ